MSRGLIQVFSLFIILVLLGGCLAPSSKTQSFMSTKVIVVIAYNGFQDLEYSQTRQILERANFGVEVASSSLGQATGKFGQKVDVNYLINEVQIEDYAALIIIGGPGAEEYLENPVIHQLIHQAVNNNKIVAAICLAPAILANADILRGKNATVWSSESDHSLIDLLLAKGVQYRPNLVVVDGGIITANGPQAADEFGQKIVEELRSL